ncbi:putative leucine-rich repeat-containing protein DDB_G0290503 isoform X2 [Clytia hemisphaerica]|uniref:putative leucine-rich repeat-containing protein DDB_G0290503 isoform X2 n=1 Tax=Clytia hemisphaerica TaxID=252671 RepID=UPI0034D4670B
MLVNSKNLSRVNISDLHTCTVCPGNAIFLSLADFEKHNQLHHREVDPHRKFIVEKINQLEKSKKHLTDQVAAIKGELKVLYKKNIGKENTIGLLQKELSSLKRKIVENNQEIKTYTDYLHNSTHCVPTAQANPNELFNKFKRCLEDECEKMVVALGAYGQPQPTMPSKCTHEEHVKSVSSESSLSDVSEASFGQVASKRRVKSSKARKHSGGVSSFEVVSCDATEQRLSALEKEMVKISDIRALKTELSELKTATLNKFDGLGQSSDDFCTLKNDVAAKSQDVANLKADLHIKTKKLEEASATVTNMKALLDEKEREADLVHQLKDRYKENAEKISQEASDLHQKFTQSSLLLEDLNNKNKLVVNDLAQAIHSLDSSKITIGKLTEDKNAMEAKFRQNETKMAEQTKLIEELEHRPTSQIREEMDEKIRLLSEQLTATDAELENHLKIIEQQDMELENAYKGTTTLNEQIGFLQNENTIFNQLLEEAKQESFEKCAEWETQMKDLQISHDSLARENHDLLCRLKDYEVANDDQAAKIEQLKVHVEELETQKIKDEERISLLVSERDELKAKLAAIEDKHSKCAVEKEDLRISFERSLEEEKQSSELALDRMRQDMRKLSAEETEKSKQLQTELDEKSTQLQSEISFLKGEVSSKSSELEHLTQQSQELQTKYDEESSRHHEQYETLNKTIINLETELAATKAQPKVDVEKIKTLEGAISEVSDKLNDSQSTKVDLDYLITDLRQDLLSGQRALDVANARATQLTNERELLEKEHSKMVENLKSEFEEKRVQIETILRVKEEESEAHVVNLKSSESKQTSLRKEIVELKNQLEGETAKANDMRRQKDLAEKKFLNRQEQLAMAEDSVCNFRNQLAELKKQQSIRDDEHQVKIEELSAKIGTLEKEGNRVDDEISSNQKLTIDNAKLTSEVKTLSAELSEKKTLERTNVDEIQSLTAKIHQLEIKLETNGGASKQKVFDLEEELSKLRQQHKDAVFNTDTITHKLTTSEEELASSRDEVKYLQEKVAHGETLVKDSDSQLEKKKKEIEIKNAKLRKQDNEITRFLDQRSELKAKITNLVRSTDAHKMAKELAEQKLKEEKMRSSELEEIVNELQEEAEHLSGSGKDIAAQLEDEKLKTSQLEDTLTKLRDHSEESRLCVERVQNELKDEKLRADEEKAKAVDEKRRADDEKRRADNLEEMMMKMQIEMEVLKATSTNCSSKTESLSSPKSLATVGFVEDIVENFIFDMVGGLVKSEQLVAKIKSGAPRNKVEEVEPVMTATSKDEAVKEPIEPLKPRNIKDFISESHGPQPENHLETSEQTRPLSDGSESPADQTVSNSAQQQEEGLVDNEVVENDHADEEYSCSFEEDIPTPSASSSSCSSSSSSQSIESEESLAQNDDDVKAMPRLTKVSKLDTQKQSKSKVEDDNEDEKLSTEEIDDELSLPIDDIDDADDLAMSDDESFGTPLLRKETTAFQTSCDDVIENNSGDVRSKPLDNHVTDAEEDVAIPKRRWGENFMSGVEQSLDEELGEMCDESVASPSESDVSHKSGSEQLDKPVSLVNNSASSKKSTPGMRSTEPVNSGSSKNSCSEYLLKDVCSSESDISLTDNSVSGSSSEDLYFSSSSSNTSSDSNDKSSKKKDKKKKKKTKKSSKKELPPLRLTSSSKSLLGDLPPLRGPTVLAKRASNDNLGNVSSSSLGERSHSHTSIDDSKSLLEMSTQASKTSITSINQEPASPALIENQNVTLGQSSNQDIPMNNQSSDQDLSPVRSQKSSILGDLPQLPGSQTSMVTQQQATPDVFSLQPQENESESTGADADDLANQDIDDILDFFM